MDEIEAEKRMNQQPLKMLILGALFVCLTAAGAHLRIPLVPVPITLQTFFVMLGGAMMGPYYGGLSMLAYVALGLMGLPVFAGSSGLAVVTGPTFGYLAAFPLASFWIGMRFRKGVQEQPSFWRRFRIFWEGTLFIYFAGMAYLYTIRNLYWHDPPALSALFLAGFVMFLPGDMMKVITAAWLWPRLASLKMFSLQKENGKE